MALSNNPNKTKTIEKRWIADIKRRARKLKDAMLNIPLSSVATNVTASQQAEINAFMAKFKETTIGLFLSTPWQNVYQTEAYERGIERADAAIKAQLTAQEAASMPSLDIGATALITTSTHSAELDFLHDRANTKLSKWIDELLFDTRSIIHEQLGIVSVDEIHEAIADRINVTTSRARTIAATEIGQASQRSVVKEVEELNIQSNEEVKVMWVTVLDNRVRHLHQHWHGKVMSNAQASRNLTISPFNCRCALKPVIEDRLKGREKAKLKKERDFLIKLAG